LRSPESYERRGRDHTGRIALTTPSAQFAIRKASRIGLFERHFRNQNALTFVSLPRADGTDDSWRDENLH